MYVGDFKSGAGVNFWLPFTVLGASPSLQAPSNGYELEVRENGTSAPLSTPAVTVTNPNGVSGQDHVAIDTSSPDYTAGNEYTVFVKPAGANGSVLLDSSDIKGTPIASFSIENRNSLTSADIVSEDQMPGILFASSIMSVTSQAEIICDNPIATSVQPGHSVKYTSAADPKVTGEAIIVQIAGSTITTTTPPAGITLAVNDKVQVLVKGYRSPFSALIDFKNRLGDQLFTARWLEFDKPIAAGRVANANGTIHVGSTDVEVFDGAMAIGGNTGNCRALLAPGTMPSDEIAICTATAEIDGLSVEFSRPVSIN